MRQPVSISRPLGCAAFLAATLQVAGSRLASAEIAASDGVGPLVGLLSSVVGGTAELAARALGRIARNNEDAGWLAWNENVVMWTVDPALHIEAEAMKEHGNARFRAGDYCGALSAYGQAITVMLGGRQLAICQCMVRLN